MIEYADVSSAALRYNLIAGNCDLTHLRPIECKQVSICLGTHQLNCEVGILGASHFAKIGIPGEGVLTEIFACLEKQATDVRQLFCGPLGLGGEIGPAEQNFAELRYVFRAWTEQWSEQTAGTLSQLSTAQGCILEFEFPTPNAVSSTTQRPVTIVLLASSENQITITTAHSYPNESLVVFTESRVIPQATKG